jgi:hypothetical protein
MRTAEEFAANPMGVWIDPDQLVEASSRGMTAEEIHRRAYAGEFAPAEPADMHMPAV